MTVIYFATTACCFPFGSSSVQLVVWCLPASTFRRLHTASHRTVLEISTPFAQPIFVHYPFRWIIPPLPKHFRFYFHHAFPVSLRLLPLLGQACIIQTVKVVPDQLAFATVLHGDKRSPASRRGIFDPFAVIPWADMSSGGSVSTSMLYKRPRHLSDHWKEGCVGTVQPMSHPSAYSQGRALHAQEHQHRNRSEWHSPAIRPHFWCDGFLLVHKHLARFDHFLTLNYVRFQTENLLCVYYHQQWNYILKASNILLTSNKLGVHRQPQTCLCRF